LERFTLLYRNDHTNEVSEVETQEALSRAEREAEEAAASLSKCILSRYHEEQVWSDKIRRMSTWGTWGLMGMNVLLFLIFQIAVEPWRRRRLVKGFEDKVVEALEKEKASQQVVGQVNIPASVFAPILPEVIDSTLETSSSESTGTVVVPSATEKSVAVPTGVTDATTPASTAHVLPVATTSASDSSSLYSRLSEISSSPLSLEFWQQISDELFSLRRITLSQHDMTVVAVQSAAAGAAVMGLLIAIVRPR
jgi:sensitive to high expression protein 9